MPRDLPHVYRAGSIGEADIVAAWLEENGIPVFVKDEQASVTLHTSMVAAPKGIEVCVAPEFFDEARRLITQHLADRHERRLRAADGEPVTAYCEDCGRPATFPAQFAGSVQSCPWCNRHMDVPGGEPADG